MPFVPHCCFPVSTDEDRDTILQLELDILPHFDLIYVCGDRISSGMEDEIDNARIAKIKVIFSTGSLKRLYMATKE